MNRNLNSALLVSGIVLIASGSYYLSSKNISNPELSKKDSILNMEADKYTKNVNKIDYTLTNTGFILDKFIQSKSVFFSGSNLNIDGKTLTGKYLNIFDKKITKEGDKYYYNRNLSRIEYSNGMIAANPKLASSDNEKKYVLKFINGFTKMKLLGEYYDFNDENLNVTEVYDMQLFLSGKDAYVMLFENTKEAKKRKLEYQEYIRKSEEIIDKYGNDPYTSNKLMEKLNNAYQVDFGKSN